MPDPRRIDFDRLNKRLADIGAKLVETEIDDGTKAFFTYGESRAFTLVRINDKITIPFYISSGHGGKANVPTNKWYPFAGYSNRGWLNKTSEEQINTFYNIKSLRLTQGLDLSHLPDSNKLQDIANILNEESSFIRPIIVQQGSHPDVRNITQINQIEKSLNEDLISLGMKPVHHDYHVSFSTFGSADNNLQLNMNFLRIAGTVSDSKEVQDFAKQRLDEITTNKTRLEELIKESEKRILSSAESSELVGLESSFLYQAGLPTRYSSKQEILHKLHAVREKHVASGKNTDYIDYRIKYAESVEDRNFLVINAKDHAPEQITAWENAKAFTPEAQRHKEDSLKFWTEYRDDAVKRRERAAKLSEERMKNVVLTKPQDNTQVKTTHTVQDMQQELHTVEIPAEKEHILQGETKLPGEYDPAAQRQLGTKRPKRKPKKHSTSVVTEKPIDPKLTTIPLPEELHTVEIPKKTKRVQSLHKQPTVTSNQTSKPIPQTPIPPAQTSNQVSKPIKTATRTRTRIHSNVGGIDLQRSLGDFLYIDYETLTANPTEIGGYHPYSVGVVSRTGRTRKSIDATIGLGAEKEIALTNTIGIPSWMQDKINESPQFKNIWDDALNLTAQESNDRRILHLNEIFSDIQRMHKKGGTIISHGGLDIHVIDSLYRSLDPSAKSTQDLKNTYGKMWEDLYEGYTKEFPENRFDSRGNIHAWLDRKDFVEHFGKADSYYDYNRNKFLKLVEKPVGKVKITSSIDIASSVIAMAEEKGHLSVVSRYPTQGTSIETLTKAYNSVHTSKPLSAGHIAIEDVRASISLTEELIDLGHKLASGEKLTDKQTTFLKTFDNVRKEEVLEKIQTKVQQAYDDRKNKRAIQKEIAKEHGNWTADYVSETYDIHTKHHGDKTALDEALKKQDSSKVKPTSGLFTKADYELPPAVAKTQGHSSAGQAVEDATNVGKKVEQKLSQKASNKVKAFTSKAKTPLFSGLLLAGGVIAALKFASGLNASSIEDKVAPSDDQYAMQGRALRPDLDPYRITTPYGMGTPRNKMMAGFGSPMLNSMRETVELMNSVTTRKLRFSIGSVAGDFIRSAKLPAEHLYAQTELMYQMDKMVPVVPNTQPLFRRIYIPSASPDGFNLYNKSLGANPHATLTVGRHATASALRNSQAMTEKDMLGGFFAASLSKVRSSKAFEDIYLDGIGFYEHKANPKLSLLDLPAVDDRLDAIHTKTEQILNTLYGFRDDGLPVGHMSDFASPADIDIERRPSSIFLEGMMKGAEARLSFTVGSLNYSAIRSWIMGERQGAIDRYEVMDDVSWYYNHTRNRGVLASTYPQFSEYAKSIARVSEQKLHSMVYYTQDGTIAMRPLDFFEMRETHINYKNRSGFDRGPINVNPESAGVEY